MAASNTKEAVRELIGRKVVGVLFDALPINKADLQSGNKTLVFEDGSGFTFSSNGSFWRETTNDIGRAVAILEKRLSNNQRELEGILEVAGRAG